MATTRIALNIQGASPVPGVTMPEFKQAGTNITIPSYSFDAGGTEGIQFEVPYVPLYGSGNITVKLGWYADSATSGDVVWGCSVACITPETDSTDVETDAWQTEAVAADTHLGTTAQRFHTATITVTALDAITTGDVFFLRVQRLGASSSPADNLSGDAQLVGVVLEYSDT